tara:strand:- start:476 stop:676 length:201 start_codon:yes stop_codon:yes gene_type:complete
MDYKTQLDDLKVEYLVNSNYLDEVWRYHPSNPNFVNPIKKHKEIKDRIDELERKINILEREDNSLN